MELLELKRAQFITNFDAIYSPASVAYFLDIFSLFFLVRRSIEIKLKFPAQIINIPGATNQTKNKFNYKEYTKHKTESSQCIY